jgi:hypothetical protein
MAELDTLINEPSDAEKRIKSLSSKVETTATERDEAVARADAEAAKTAEAERRASFAEGFTDIVASNPAAKDFKADIQTKVMSGMSLEDATFAVLGKAGKLGNQPEPTITNAGGSASTNLPSQGTTKSAAEMTQAERRAALEEALIIT